MEPDDVRDGFASVIKALFEIPLMQDDNGDPSTHDVPLAASQWSKRLRVDKRDLLARAPSGTETAVHDGGNDGSGYGASSKKNPLTERGLLAGCQMRMSQRLAPNWDSNRYTHTFREPAR